MKKTTIKLKLLTVCMCLIQQGYALESIEEQELSEVTGQDGMVITHEISKASIAQVNWYDPNPTTNTKMGLGLHDVEINGKDNNPILSQLEIDVGATSEGAGLRLAASVSPFQATADLNLVKIACTTNPCSQSANSIRTAGTQSNQSLGALGISTSTPLSVLLQTSAGLFNKDSIASIDFQLKNATISHQLGENSLILNDFNFNFAGSGYLYIDPNEGMVLTTREQYVDLKRAVDLTDIAAGRVNPTNPGVNIDLRYNTPNNERKNIMRLGASGAVTNARLSMSADQTQIGTFDVSNKVNGVLERQDKNAPGYSDLVGEGGLNLGLSADFTGANSTGRPAAMAPTTLEIGHTGKGSHAVQFSNLRPLTTRNANGVLHGKNAHIDLGNIYINTITAKSLDFIINENMQKTLGSSSSALKQRLSTAANGEEFASIAIRGMDFQSIAEKARFISDNSLPELTGDGGSWGIGIPIYNLNANVALSGTTYGTDNKQAIAYNMMVSTEGYGIDKKTGLPSTTSIILIDGKNGEHGEAVNYYAGFRNIDALIKSEGIIGYEDEGIYIRADDLLIAAKAELAIGQLPGSKYNCTNASVTKCGEYVPHDNFFKRDDVLTNIAFKLDGSGELLIIPGVDPTSTSPDTNFLSFDANFKFRPLSAEESADNKNLGSYFSFANEDIDSTGVLKTSSINFNRMEGHLGVKAKVRVSADTVTLDNQVKLNYKDNIATPFKTNFAMATNGNMQNMASIALTGGTIRSTMGITPR
ncbi:hypothetical protein H0S56_03540 [Acinetobacter lwoffii]|uniref:DUF6160 family protein n=1 Tax=Acinetobacter lwoffii TaxID=28090 RepID=UPI00189E9BB7|nr:DUF6160 family protein [Acinetobacter lwoffii]QPF32757.1 hypothetical protein H0S56_03540 [Acinetobacter lwoffii]